MKIPSIKLPKEKYAMICLSAIAGTVFAAYLVLYVPLMKQLKAKHSECKALESQAGGARSIIGSAGKEYGDRLLTTEEGSSMVIDELAKRGKLIGVNFISIKPGEIMEIKESQHKTLPIEIEIEGSDEQCAAFLGSLDELKNSVITVKSFDIMPNAEDRSRLNAQLTVNVYLSGNEDAK